MPSTLPAPSPLAPSPMRPSYEGLNRAVRPAPPDNLEPATVIEQGQGRFPVPKKLR
jgi:hypothetical protein